MNQKDEYSAISLKKLSLFLMIKAYLTRKDCFTRFWIKISQEDDERFLRNIKIFPKRITIMKIRIKINELLSNNKRKERETQ